MADEKQLGQMVQAAETQVPIMIARSYVLFFDVPEQRRKFAELLPGDSFRDEL